jgi:membrane protease YdiL (CAAX protease family)
VIVRNFPHSAVLQQLAAPQPKMVIVLLCLFIPGWLPTLLAHALMRWSDFSTFVSNHDLGYRLTFFVVQLSLTCGAIVFVSKKYRSALWTPLPSWRRGISISVLILLPLFFYHLSSSLSGIQGAILLSGFGDEGNKELASVHDQVWSRLAYGSSADGVAFSSIVSFVAPALEEIVFAGFVVNMIAKPYGFTAAVVGAPVCFALVHVFQFGVGLHLIPLFLAGVTYASIRVCSGSLLLAVFGHWMINAVIFLPKWLIAVIRFS